MNIELEMRGTSSEWKYPLVTVRLNDTVQYAVDPFAPMDMQLERMYTVLVNQFRHDVGAALVTYAGWRDCNNPHDVPQWAREFV